MNPYFESQERQDLLRAELKKWMYAPWRHHSCSINGTDCIGLLYGVFCNVGAFDRNVVTIPPYSRDWHLHSTQEILMHNLKNTDVLVEMGTETDRMNGDVFVFRYGKAESHVGIYFNREIYHSVTNLYVIKSPFKENGFYSKIRTMFRPMENI